MGKKTKQGVRPKAPLIVTINPRTGERRKMTEKKYREIYQRVLKERTGYWRNRTKPGVQRGIDGEWERYL